MLRTRACALASVALFSACGEPPPHDPCDYRVCAIESEACVEQVAEAVACHRDVDPVTPEVRFLTRDDVLAEWTAEEPTPEELALQLQYNDTEALVGLMPFGYTPEQVAADQLEDVAAFYDRDTRSVTIITDNGIDDVVVKYEILVHEMIHVYQDAAWDLDALSTAHAGTWDRFLGLRAAIEGDAQLYMNFADLELLGLHPADVDWGRYFTDFQDGMLELAAESEAPSLDTLTLFPYAWGVEYQHSAWRAHDESGSERVLNDPPDSVRQAMRNWAGDVREPINEDSQLDPAAVPILPGYTFLGGGHQGVWLVNAMLQRTAFTSALFLSGLDQVSADFFSAFRHDASGTLVAVWRIRNGMAILDVIENGASLWSTLRTDQPMYAWEAHGSDLVLVRVQEGPQLDAQQVLDAMDRWQSPQDVEPAAGVEGALRRRIHAPWTCNHRTSR